MVGYFDRDGQPINVFQWAKLMEKDAYRQVARTQDMKLHGRRVSTVWMGLDHQFGDGPPLIFESMVFNKEGESIDCRRSSTLEAAKDDHAELCAKWELSDPLAREIFDSL